VKAASMHAPAHMCVQTVVQAHWMAESKITILNIEILFDMLKKFNLLMHIKIIELTVVIFKLMISLMNGHSGCVPSETNITMPLV